MEFNQLLEKILKAQKSIRFAAVFDKYGTIIEKIQRKDTTPLIDKYETQNMLREAASLWYHRKNLSHKLGKGHYSMTEYDNLIRLTMPLDSDHFLLISHDKIDNKPSVIREISQVLEHGENEPKLYQKI